MGKQGKSGGTHSGCRAGRGLVLALALCLAASSPARAEDEAVSEELVFQADTASVKALLADTGLAFSLNQDVLSYRVEDAPPCQLVHVTTRGVTAPFHYTVRRCPTSTGFRETLVSGDGNVEAMDVEWRAVPHGDGTKVRLSVLTRIARVPQFLVNQHARQSIAASLRSLGRKADAQAR